MSSHKDTYSTAWSHDFCLSCDRQTSEGAYCSQACRLVDLEKAGHPSEPPSPLTYSTSYGSSAGSHPSPGLFLSPAINFSAYKTGPPSPTTRTPLSQTAPQQGYYNVQTQSTTSTWSTSHYGWHPSAGSSYLPQRDQRSKSLVTQSSRASLSSINSVNASQGLSENDLSQLRSYVSAFDQTRDLKRRMTYG